MFISIDGGDGAGKTTQVQLLAKSLREAGRPVLTCRDPGTTRLGEAVRKILLRDDGIEISPMSETLLFMAARTQMVEEIIRPALSNGSIVITDRFLLSTVVYQGFAGGLDPTDIMTIGRTAMNRLIPDLTIVLDIDPEAGMARIQRPLDRMESKGVEYHRRVRDGFLAGARLLSDHYGARVEIINALETEREIAEKIHSIVFDSLENSKK